MVIPLDIVAERCISHYAGLHLQLAAINRSEGNISTCRLTKRLKGITSWGDIYISWDYAMTPCVGNVVLRRKPQSTFRVSVRL
jgi:hypothetical protein